MSSFYGKRKGFIKHHNCNRNGNKGYDDHDHGVDSESNYGNATTNFITLMTMLTLMRMMTMTTIVMMMTLMMIRMMVMMMTMMMIRMMVMMMTMMMVVVVVVWWR